MKNVMSDFDSQQLHTQGHYPLTITCKNCGHQFVINISQAHTLVRTKDIFCPNCKKISSIGKYLYYKSYPHASDTLVVKDNWETQYDTI